MTSQLAILISILLLYAIATHLYVLPHLWDAMAMLSNNGAEGGPVVPAAGPSQYDASANAAKATTSRIMVFNSGPNDARSNRAKLYNRSLNYFLLHGIVCNAGIDTVVLVSHEYHAALLPRIQKQNDMCRRWRGGGGCRLPRG
jgi:hypothetical protein